MTTEIDGIKIIFGDPKQPKCLPLNHPKARWDKWGTKSITLTKGTIRRRGALPLPCDILFEQDVPVHLRDGTKIYVDVFRPINDGLKVPALMAWSPYGKQPGRGNQVLDDFPFRMGVPLSKLSELQKWEGPDPAYWVKYGYAIVNPDPRGVYKSEGNIYCFGSQEGRDGADVVDWVGKQPWSNGKVALTGNSYLSISQWFIAAERPKHLAAISPWEGSSDYFREISPGGVESQPALDFGLQLLSVNVGENSWENPLQTMRENPTFQAYVEEKAAQVRNIEVPAYVVASWSNPIHSYGTYRAFCRLNSEKWLRVHDSWEWPDYYEEVNRSDLHRFFDRYLKDIDNGWETTPRFRAKIIDTSIPLPMTGSLLTSSAFPVKESRPLKLFFDATNMALNSVYPPTCAASTHGNGPDLSFEYVFDKDTTLCGPLEIHLAISLAGNDDADVFVYTEKVLKSGKVGTQLKIPYVSVWQTLLIRTAAALQLDEKLKLLFYRGPWGEARVSRRVLDQRDAIPGFPIIKSDQMLPVQEGSIVLVQPTMRPIGMKFSAGEKLRVAVSGTNKLVYPEVDQSTLRLESWSSPNDSGAKITLNCGANSAHVDSYMMIPVIENS